ncbi:MAG: hypothetical protein ABJN98_20395 [Roseibium sp.]
MANSNSVKVHALEMKERALFVAMPGLDDQPGKRHDCQKWSDQRGPNPLVMLGLERS